MAKRITRVTATRVTATRTEIDKIWNKLDQLKEMFEEHAETMHKVPKEGAEDEDDKVTYLYCPSCGNEIDFEELASKKDDDEAEHEIVSRTKRGVVLRCHDYETIQTITIDKE